MVIDGTYTTTLFAVDEIKVAPEATTTGFRQAAVGDAGRSAEPQRSRLRSALSGGLPDVATRH
jgi:hypothetical protein